MNRRWAIGAGALGLGWTIRRTADARVSDVPLCRLRASPFEIVGPEFPARSGVAGDPVLGEMDDFDSFAREDFDTARVAPAVRRFYERTSEYGMMVLAHWHRPFRTGAALASRLTSAVEQLNLPGPGDGPVHEVESSLLALEPTADGREDARFWVRTDVDTGEAVFVAVYASHVHDGERYVNVGVPLPGATLSTVLRVGALPLADRDETGLTLTTRAPGHPGLYLSVAGGDFRLPMQQVFRVWPADAVDAPAFAADLADASRDSADATVVASQEMWLGGAQFLTVRYVGYPLR